MKIITIGDIHGRTIWKEIIKKEEFDLVIFLGDYFDTHYDISPEQQKQNFKDIIEFKKDNIDKVIVLFGNHDYHYLPWVNENYSGYQPWQKFDIGDLLQDAIKTNLMQMCHIQDDIIFSHAGVTKTWCFNTFNELPNVIELERKINASFIYTPAVFGFTMGSSFSRTGDDICQSPIWVRPQSLIIDQLDGYKQVVGHTAVSKIDTIQNITLVDALEEGEYLTIINNEFIVNKINKSE